MATITKRSVARTADKDAADKVARAVRNVKGKAKGKAVTSRRKAEPKAEATSIRALQSDKRIASARETYRNTLNKTEALVTFMKSIITAWASSNYVADKENAAWIVEQERTAREGARREGNAFVSARDERGVNASEMKRVLLFASKKNATATFNIITDIAKNWSMCKMLAFRASTYFDKNKKVMPGRVWIERECNRIKSEKRAYATAAMAKAKTAKRNRSKGIDNTSDADTLVTRALHALKNFDRRFAAKLGCEKKVKDALAALKPVIDTANAFALQQAAAAVAKGKGKGKGKASNVIAMPLKADGTIDMAAVRKMAKTRKPVAA
jgi:hypothetical protein